MTTGIWYEAWRRYRELSVRDFGVAALVALPLFLLGVELQRIHGVLGWAAMTFIPLELTLVLSALDLAREVEESARAAWGRVLRRAPRILGAQLRFAASVLAPLVPVAALFVFVPVRSGAHWVYVVFFAPAALIALVFSALRFARLCMILPAVVLEDRGVGAALRRSTELTHGRLRDVGRISAKWWALTFAIVFAVALPLALAGASGLLRQAVVDLGVDPFVSPVGALLLVVLYADLATASTLAGA